LNQVNPVSMSPTCAVYIHHVYVYASTNSLVPVKLCSQ